MVKKKNPRTTPENLLLRDVGFHALRSRAISPKFPWPHILEMGAARHYLLPCLHPFLRTSAPCVRKRRCPPLLSRSVVSDFRDGDASFLSRLWEKAAAVTTRGHVTVYRYASLFPVAWRPPIWTIVLVAALQNSMQMQRPFACYTSSSGRFRIKEAMRRDPAEQHMEPRHAVKNRKIPVLEVDEVRTCLHSI
jgi:hypothetical protein